MKTIYLVRGVTGEWDDRQDWTVNAFSDPIAAQMFIGQLECVLREYGAWSPEKDKDVDYDTRRLAERALRDLDSCVVVDYTGTSYYMDKVVFYE